MDFLPFLRRNWRFLLAGFILALTSSYGQTFFISVFAGEIMEAFDLTDGQWGLTYTVGTTVSALVMVQAGVLTDRFRVRVLTHFVMAGLACACLVMASAPAAWVLIPSVFLLRFFGQGMLPHLSAVAMARWFTTNRGKALATASMGFAAGQAVLPLIFVALLTTLDWRMLWVLAAGIVLLTIPVMIPLLRLERTPQSMAQQDQSAGMDGVHWTRRAMLSHRLFWLMVPALLGPPAWGTALFFQQVHLTEVKGWPLVSFVALFPLLTVTVVGSTFATGWLVDRLGTGRLIPFYLLPFAAGFAVIALAPSIPVAAIGLMLVGLGQGQQGTLIAAFWAEFYGTRHLGAIKAVGAAVMVFASAVGPGITGVLIDAGIYFPQQMLWLVGYFLLAAGAATIGVLTARPRLTALA